LGEDTPPPLPPEPKKTAAGRLKDYVISAATSPEILLPVLGIVAIILLRDHLEAPVARYIAGIVTKEENLSRMTKTQTAPTRSTPTCCRRC